MAQKNYVNWHGVACHLTCVLKFGDFFWYDSLCSSLCYNFLGIVASWAYFTLVLAIGHRFVKIILSLIISTSGGKVTSLDSKLSIAHWIIPAFTVKTKEYVLNQTYIHKDKEICAHTLQFLLVNIVFRLTYVKL